MQEQDVRMHVNGKQVSGKVETRTHLGDFLVKQQDLPEHILDVSMVFVVLVR